MYKITLCISSYTQCHKTCGCLFHPYQVDNPENKPVTTELLCLWLILQCEKRAVAHYQRCAFVWSPSGVQNPGSKPNTRQTTKGTATYLYYIANSSGYSLLYTEPTCI